MVTVRWVSAQPRPSEGTSHLSAWGGGLCLLFFQMADAFGGRRAFLQCLVLLVVMQTRNLLSLATLTKSMFWAQERDLCNPERFVLIHVHRAIHLVTSAAERKGPNLMMRWGVQSDYCIGFGFLAQNSSFKSKQGGSHIYLPFHFPDVVTAAAILTGVGRQNRSRTPLSSKFCMNSVGVTQFKWYKRTSLGNEGKSVIPRCCKINRQYLISVKQAQTQEDKHLYF